MFFLQTKPAYCKKLRTNEKLYILQTFFSVLHLLNLVFFPIETIKTVIKDAVILDKCNDIKNIVDEIFRNFSSEYRLLRYLSEKLSLIED